jgi:hypothetical protein
VEFQVPRVRKDGEAHSIVIAGRELLINTKEPVRDITVYLLVPVNLAHLDDFSELNQVVIMLNLEHSCRVGWVE